MNAPNGVARERFEPGFVVLHNGRGYREPFWIEANGTVKRVTVRGRIDNPDIIRAVQQAARRQASPT